MWNKKMPARPVVAVAGATGAVGLEFLKVLHDLAFPASEVGGGGGGGRGGGKRAVGRGGAQCGEKARIRRLRRCAGR